MKQLSILAFEALPKAGPPPNGTMSQRGRSLPREELAASLRGVLGREPINALSRQGNGRTRYQAERTIP
jgi:hypothetical protein